MLIVKAAPPSSSVAISLCEKAAWCGDVEGAAYNLIQERIKYIAGLESEVSKRLPPGTDAATINAAVIEEIRARRKAESGN
jgi:hypothetical protein